MMFLKTSVAEAISFLLVLLCLTTPCPSFGESEDLQDKFENGTELIEAARREPDPMQRARLLQDAIKSVQKLVEQHPDHDLAITARLQLGNVNAELAREQVKRANLSVNAELEKDARYKARVFLTAAIRLFEEIEKKLRDELQGGQVGDKDRESRIKLRGDYLQAKLLIAASTEEMADTHDSKDGKRDELLMVAADQYHECYKGFRTRLAGLYARLYEGRCLQKRHEYDKALGIYEELLEQPAGGAPIDSLRKKASDLAESCRQERDSKKD